MLDDNAGLSLRWSDQAWRHFETGLVVPGPACTELTEGKGLGDNYRKVFFGQQDHQFVTLSAAKGLGDNHRDASLRSA